MSGFMTGRSTANLLTRTTAFLAIGFFLTSVLLVWLSNGAATSGAPRSLIDQGGSAPTTQERPAAPAPAPAAPAEPTAPLAK
jgi:preprotein translocase subunit SecG